jgi:hypothetical protein
MPSLGKASKGGGGVAVVLKSGTQDGKSSRALWLPMPARVRIPIDFPLRRDSRVAFAYTV